MKPMCQQCQTTHWTEQPCETAEQKAIRLGGQAPVAVAKVDTPVVIPKDVALPAPVVVDTVNQTEVPQPPEQSDVIVDGSDTNAPELPAGDLSVDVDAMELNTTPEFIDTVPTIIKTTAKPQRKGGRPPKRK